MIATPEPKPLLLREREVLKLIGYSSRTLRGWVSSGRFPQPVRQPGDDDQRRSKRWLASDVEKWVANLAAGRNKPPEDPSS